ncbi:MAG: ergothioneine biosynthesis protein EgtC [Sandaracinaceae bacterium]|nr:ergothioneine biosynthesis protein EgtC [Sandaracinaceae bacterium]
MCRLAAYSGPPRSLHSLWLAPPHSLEVQSYAPREMTTARLNADGFGMVWYTDAEPAPARYRTVLPLWADENVRAMARHLVTGCALANVRSATVGMPVQLSNVSPFVDGRWAFTHNGFVRDFSATLARRVRESLDDARYAAIEGNTDSELIGAFVMTRLAALTPGSDPTDAVGGALEALSSMAGAQLALLNVVVTDGAWIVAMRHAVNGEAPTLYRRERAGAVELASEPLDDDGWEAVAKGAIVTVSPHRQLSCRTF